MSRRGPAAFLTTCAAVALGAPHLFGAAPADQAPQPPTNLRLSIGMSPGSSGSVPTSYDAIADRVTRAKPPVPALGAAGFQFEDPTFHSRIVRITDGRTRPSTLDVSYRTPSASGQMAWNSRSTRFYVTSTDGTIVPFAFDASTGRASRIAGDGDAGLILNFNNEPAFSSADPNAIYGIVTGGNNRTISKYDFSTRAYSTIVNLDTIVSGLAGTFTGAMLTGGKPTESMAVVFGGPAQDQHPYLMWFPIRDLSQRKLLDTVRSTINGVSTNIVLDFKLHGSGIDRSGRYVILTPTAADLAAPRRAAQLYVWDTVTDLITAMTRLPGGHGALGYGVNVNQDCCTSTTWDAAQWQLRSLATPNETRDLVSPVLDPKEVYSADHASWSNAQPDRLMPILISTYHYGTDTPPWRAWDEEIIMVRTDGTDSMVWRFAHHRSNVHSDADPAALSFWYTPRANVAPNGQWALFTSNWEKTLGLDARDGQHRQDVFLVQLR